MRLLILSGLRHYLHHKWQALLALVGVALGVAIVLAVDLASYSANQSFEQSAQQIRGAATHRIVGANDMVDETLYGELATQPGLPKMAPVVEGWLAFLSNEAEADERMVQFVGIDPFAEASFQRLTSPVSGEDGMDINWFTLPGSVILSKRLAEHYQLSNDESFSVRVNGKTSELTLIGTHQLPSDLVLMDIASAQEIANMFGQLSYIDLIATPNSISALQPLLPAAAKLLDARADKTNISQLSSAFQLNLTALSLLALLVGIFLIFNAISFSFVQRRIMIGRLRAIGVSQRELFLSLLIESLILGIIGCLIGISLGLWLGTHLTQLVAGTINELYYRVDVQQMTASTSSIIKALLLGIAGTLAAALAPSLRATSAPPVSALSRAYLEAKTRHYLPWLSAIGVVSLSAGLLLGMWPAVGLIGGFAGIFLVIIGAALMMPMLISLFGRFFFRQRLPLLTSMAVRDLDRHQSRLSIAGAALMVALAAGLGIGIMVESMRGAVTHWLNELLNADLYVAHQHRETGARLNMATVDRITHLSQVQSFSLYRHRSIEFNNKPVVMVAASLSQQSRNGFSLLSQPAASVWQRFDNGELLISEPLANRFQLVPGGELTLATNTGDVTFRVAGIFRDYASEHGRIFIDRNLYIKHWQDSAVTSIALFSKQQDSHALETQVRSIEQHTEPIDVTLGQGILDESLAIFDRTFRITEVLHLLALSIAFIGILSALMALQLERAKEYAVLRALGFTPLQIGGLIGYGSFILGLLAALASIPTGLAMAWLLINSVQLRAFGWTLPFNPEASDLMQTIALGVLAALLATIYPAWHAMRSLPAGQLREE